MRPGLAARSVFAAACVTVPAIAVAQPAPGTAGDEPARSPRNASYRIEATLDAEARTLDGQQVLTWTNVQDRPTGELRFHLYWNAWRNDRSTWMIEDQLRGRSDRGERVHDDDWSWMQVDRVRLLAGQTAGSAGGAGEELDFTDEIDLTSAMRFESPDDGNPHDRTLLVVPLPFEVQPGETVRVALDWRSKVPRTFARTGVRGDYFFIAHWFPAVGVHEADGWNARQYHAATEYYSDYGSYDVSLTVPSGHVLGATGRQVERRDNANGTTTWRHVQDDVHTFTWTSSPDYQVFEETFDEPGLPPVAMRLLMQPEHLGQTERHFNATRNALKYYGTWYGPYPYGHITIIDPAWGSGAGGMEYPTLFTCGTRVFNPFGGGSPEGVTVHEAGHQFWYGIVGNNEFEHAWIDEGFNTFSTGRTMQTAYGDDFLVRRFLSPPRGSDRESSGFFPLAYRDVRQAWWVRRLDGYRAAALSDTPLTPTFLYHPETGSSVSYNKTALWLMTLENWLGWETLQPMMSAFFQRHAFGHPGPEDFLAVADEVSGRDLSWFFDQVLRDSVVFDYAVTSVSSVRAAPKGFVEGADVPVLADAGGDRGDREGVDEDEDDGDAEDDEGTVYRTDVVVKRLGGGVFPVDVLLVFRDGHEVRERWEGREHWKAFTVEHPAKLQYAAIDPDRVLMLDVDYTNNSRVLKPKADLPARKWASKWMIWLQDRLAAFASFI